MRNLLGLVLGAGVLGGLAALPSTAAALSLEAGELRGRIDTTLSVGAAMRMRDRDDALVGITNGGTARTVNEDDGNLGFKQYDFVNAVAKATHDVDVAWRNFGLFSRFSYFYDERSDNADRREDRLNADGVADTARDANTYELGSRGRNRLGTRFDLFDLFLYGRFSIGQRFVSVRAGNQAVNWGESTFIRNSINVINPIDVARIRLPGAELREALLPTPMLWASFPLSNSVSAELVWMTSFKRTRIDPRGHFFSTNDTVSPDSDKAIVTFGRRFDDNHDQTALPPTDPDSSAWVEREAGPELASGTRQGGVALRYFSAPLWQTEFGAYWLTYHSRTPLLSVVSGGRGPLVGNAGITNFANIALPTCSQDPTGLGAGNCRATYFSEFPDNIHLYGLSFNTNIGDLALQGEYSFRKNQPVQISGAELIMAALGVGNTITSQDGPTAFGVPAGTVIRGFERVNMHQLQMTLTKAFGPTLGADQWVVLGEAGVTRLMLPDDNAFGGPGAALPAPGSGATAGANFSGAASNGSCQTRSGDCAGSAFGFADRTSWGYVLVSRLDFENLIGAAGVSPRLVFAHDVKGVGPTFNHGTKAVTLGVALNYLQRWQADVAFTTFFGGRTFSGSDPFPVPAGQSADYATASNPNKDRDFLTFNVSYAF